MITRRKGSNERAGKSTGPRSRSGKARSSQNARKHGLNISLSSNAAFASAIDELAAELAQGDQRPHVWACCHSIAEAHLEIERVKRAKLAVLQRVSRIGRLDPLKFTFSGTEQAFLEAILRGQITEFNTEEEIMGVINGMRHSAIPPDKRSSNAEWSSEQLDMILQELRKLDRYEQRARTRRDRALKEFTRQ